MQLTETLHAHYSPELAALSQSARQALATYVALTPQALAARQREKLIRLVSHHYYNPWNAAYRRALQRHGLHWGEPRAASSSVFGRLFARLGNETEPQRIPVPEAMPLRDILALLPVVDKGLLLEGKYDQRPAVAPEEIAFTPASSGTTSGQRGYTALARSGLWPFALETTLALLMAQGIDAATATGYLVAHFKRDDPADQRASGTFAAFSGLTDRAPELLRLGSTQDTVEQHIAELARPALWSFSSPHFYRQIVARANPAQLRRLSLQVILWGGGGQSADEYAAVMEGLGLRHSLGVYAVSEMGVVAAQFADRTPYGIFADQYLVEIVDDHGNQVAPGETGTVLLTSLWHTATPLIRYRIGDEARYLGGLDQADGLWRELGEGIPDSASHPLAQGVLKHATFFDAIKRLGGLIIGDGKVSYEDVAAMQAALAQAGTPAPVLQLAKRHAPDGRHEVVVRLEAPAAMHAAIATNARQVVRLADQLAYLFDDGELPPPVIEVLSPGKLGGVNFKVPPLVDET